MAKPKVISLLKTDRMNNLFLSISVAGEPTDVFVQCTSYDLKLPVNGQERRVLDVFEETVLRMLRVKRCSAAELADILCLEKDLVQFIIVRLTEKGFLKDKYTLSEIGEEQLNLQKSLREEVEYQTAKLFIVNGCDILLPYIFLGEFLSEDVIDSSPSGIILGFGSIGNQKKVRGGLIRGGKNDGRVPVLPQVTIKNAIKRYNSLADRQKKSRISLVDGYGIESTRGEDICFHMQAAVQAGNIEELLVSDGFVSNIDGLSEFIQSVNPDFVTSVHGKAVRMGAEEGESGGGDGKAYAGKYPEVVKYCREMDKYIHRATEESDLDDIRQINEENRQAVINCYSMLEWAFYYHSRKYPISDSLLQIFMRQRAYENLETLKSLSRKVGIGCIEECARLFSNFDGGKAEMIYRNPSDPVPAMQIVLPLSIIGASENNESELIHLIAADRGFLLFLSDVGKRAGEYRHDSAIGADDIKMEEIRNRAVDIITAILPDIVIQRDGAAAANHVSNERLKAVVACEKALGSLLYASLAEGVQADFRRISPDKSLSQLPAPYEYVQVLYRILQTAFYEESQRYTAKKWISKEECIRKGEALLGRELPKTVTTVGAERYQAAQKGQRATLGAHFLVLISVAPKEELEQLKRQDIVHVVDKILEYRKHANDVSLMVSDKELSDLRGKVINIIKITGGYCDGK